MESLNLKTLVKTEAKLYKGKGRYEWIIIIDKSGSMMGTETFIVNEFNSMVRSLTKKQKEKILLTVVLFDNQVETVYFRKPLEKIDEFDYFPGYTTAIYDSLGGTLNAMMEAHQEEEKAFNEDQDEKEADFNLEQDRLEREFKEAELYNEYLYNQNPKNKNKAPYKKKEYTKRKYYKREKYVRPSVHGAISTDGYENDSTIYDEKSITDLLDFCQNKLGYKLYGLLDFALDKNEVVRDTKIPIENMASFVADADGFKSLFSTITGMIKHTADLGFVPDNWEALADHENILSTIVDEAVKDIFNDAHKLLSETEKSLALIEIQARTNGFDNDEFRDVYSDVSKSLHCTQDIINTLNQKNLDALANVLKVYHRRQSKQWKKILNAAVGTSIRRVASANNIVLGSIRKMINNNILEFANLEKHFYDCKDNLTKMRSYIRKDKSNNTDIYDKIEKDQETALRTLIEQVFARRTNWIGEIIKTSSAKIFNRDKNTTIGSIEFLYNKAAFKKAVPEENIILNELIKLRIILSAFTIRDEFKEVLKTLNNPVIKKSLNDEEQLKKWIDQVIELSDIESKLGPEAVKEIDGNAIVDTLISELKITSAPSTTVFPSFNIFGSSRMENINNSRGFEVLSQSQIDDLLRSLCAGSCDMELEIEQDDKPRTLTFEN